MTYMSEKQYNAQMKTVRLMNQSKEREMKLREEKNKYRRKIKMPPTSKIVLLVVFLLCLQIVFFCERIMVETGDTSALYVLIGAPVSLMPIAISYMIKSKAENTAGGIVYDQAMRDQIDELDSGGDAGSETTTY